MVLLGFTDNFVRVIAAESGLWQFHALRSAMAIPLMVAAGLMLGMPLRPRRWGPVAVRGLIQATSMLIYFGALAFMPIAQVAAGLFTAPIFVLLFSAVLFGQRIGPRRLTAVGLGFLGILVMLRPDPTDLQLATFVPVAAGAFYGLSNLLTREWCAEEPVGALLLGFFLALGIAGLAGSFAVAGLPAREGVATAADFLVRPWGPLSGLALMVIFVQAAGSLLAVGCIAWGYQSGDTSYLTVFEYFFLVTASFWAWVIWGETLDATGYLGIALIAGSGLLIARAGAPGSSTARL
jgi:drug/metabolite transporter (DMT)-like permease